MTWHTAVVLLALLGVAAVVVLALRAWPSDDLTAPEVLARSQAAEEEVLAQLTEGKVLHLRDEVYRRHGPAASLIRAMSSEWYLPERYVHEFWLEVGPGGKFSHVRGSVRSETGDLLRDITTVGTEVLTRDVASGAEERHGPLRVSVEDIASRMHASIELRREQLESGTAVVTGEGKIDGRPTLIVEETMPAPPKMADVADGQAQGYSIIIPYTQDIDAVRWLRRTEVDSESFLALRWSVVVVGSAGREIVLEEKYRAAFTVVDQSAMPRALKELAGRGWRIIRY